MESFWDSDKIHGPTSLRKIYEKESRHFRVDHPTLGSVADARPSSLQKVYRENASKRSVCRAAYAKICALISSPQGPIEQQSEPHPNRNSNANSNHRDRTQIPTKPWP
jgi:hypothetical protein